MPGADGRPPSRAASAARPAWTTIRTELNRPGVAIPQCAFRRSPLAVIVAGHVLAVARYTVAVGAGGERSWRGRDLGGAAGSLPEEDHIEIHRVEAVGGTA